MNKLAKIISELSCEELKLIKKDVVEGNMETLINERLKSFESSKRSAVCPICSVQMPDAENSEFTLIFGSKDFRRKASFDGADCLEYFIEHLKKIEEKKIRKGDEDNGAFRDYKDI